MNLSSIKVLLKRILEAILVLFLIISLVFFMIRSVPGGPFDTEKEAAPEVILALEAQYGLDKSLWRQYFSFVKNLIQGDLGPSFKYAGWSVNELIFQKLPVSIELGFWALLIAICLGIPLGISSAIKSGHISDYFFISMALIGICIPSFVIGPLLQIAFSIHFGWFPLIGWDHYSQKILPSFTLGLGYAAVIARLTRTVMIEEILKNYPRTARAKGLTEFRINMIHCFKNGLPAIIAYLAPAISGLISGSFVVETIFHVPGLGRFFVNAAINRDYTMILGTTLIYSCMIIGLNLFADGIQKIINPMQQDR